MGSASLIYLGMVLGTKEKRKRENDPSGLQGWLFLSAFAFGYSSGQPPCRHSTQLQSSWARGLLSTCSVREAGGANLFPCTAFHPADGEAMTWVNAIPVLPWHVFAHLSPSWEGAKPPGRSCGTTAQKEQVSSTHKGWGAHRDYHSDGRMCGRSQGLCSLQALRMARED